MTHISRPLAFLFLLATVALAGCGGDDASAQTGDVTTTTEPAPASNPSLRVGTVLETMDGGGYTYALLDVGGEKVWIAGPSAPVEVGATIETPIGNEMRDFRSNTLDRTFDVVWFVGGIQQPGSTPDPAAAVAAAHGGADPAPHGAGAAEPVPSGPIEPLADGKTVAAILGDPAGLAGQVVALRGRVTKVNRGILGADWLHVQDGSGSAEAGTNDLTVMAVPGAVVKVGDVAVIRGKVATDQDFGMGYAYAVLLQEATVEVE